MLSTRDLPPECLSALVEASAAINSAQGLDDTLTAIARAAADVMKAEAASVIMLDVARGKQVFRAAFGERAEQLIGMEYDEGEGVSGKVARTGRATTVHDVTKEEAHYMNIDARIGFRTRSLVAAPLINKGRTLGVVEVLNPIEAARFTPSDQELCRIFGNLAAIAAANAELHDRLERENRGLKQAFLGPQEMIGEGAAMQKVKDLIRRAARTTATVLLLGETGAGKELAARLVHANSDRADRAFIAVNCAALPETLLESELFGHEAGAFTGAVARKLGRFELADGGTIFLDEIADTSPSTQVRFLRVLEEKQITRLGGERAIGCDVRVIAASNRNLSEQMRAGRFRDDLYYRLNVFPIEIPPLRERREDIPLLAEHFIRRLAAEMKTPAPRIAPEVMAALTRYDFPGNIRELQNILERACLLCCFPGETGPAPGHIRLEHIPHELVGETQAASPRTSALAGQEKAMILSALKEHNWNQTRAAEALGISRYNLRYRMKKYGIRRPT